MERNPVHSPGKQIHYSLYFSTPINWQGRGVQRESRWGGDNIKKKMICKNFQQKIPPSLRLCGQVNQFIMHSRNLLRSLGKPLEFTQPLHSVSCRQRLVLYTLCICGIQSTSQLTWRPLHLGALPFTWFDLTDLT